MAITAVRTAFIQVVERKNTVGTAYRTNSYSFVRMTSHRYCSGLLGLFSKLAQACLGLLRLAQLQMKHQYLQRPCNVPHPHRQKYFWAHFSQEKKTRHAVLYRARIPGLARVICCGL